MNLLNFLEHTKILVNSLNFWIVPWISRKTYKVLVNTFPELLERSLDFSGFWISQKITKLFQNLGEVLDSSLNFLKVPLVSRIIPELLRSFKNFAELYGIMPKFLKFCLSIFFQVFWKLVEFHSGSKNSSEIIYTPRKLPNCSNILFRKFLIFENSLNISEASFLSLLNSLCISCIIIIFLFWSFYR